MDDENIVPVLIQRDTLISDICNCSTKNFFLFVHAVRLKNINLQYVQEYAKSFFFFLNREYLLMDHENTFCQLQNHVRINPLFMSF